MQFFSSNRLFIGCLAALQLLVSIVSVSPMSAWAQLADSIPPVVEYQPASEGVRGQNQMFTTTVTDNEGVSSVVLNYRLDKSSIYEKLDMQASNDSDIYTATIESTDAIEGVTIIQYYIEAKDIAGNRTLQGFAFSPLELLLVDKPATVSDGNNSASSETNTVPTVGMSTRQKVLLGLLGVITVGVLASSSSGGGSGASQGVDVTIVVEPLP